MVVLVTYKTEKDPIKNQAREAKNMFKLFLDTKGRQLRKPWSDPDEFRSQLHSPWSADLGPITLKSNRLQLTITFNFMIND